MTLLVLLFFGAGRASAGEFSPFLVTPRTVQERMEDPSHGYGFDHQFQFLKLYRAGPGLRVAPGAMNDQVEATLYFAEMLHYRYGLTTVLAPRLDKWSTPVFSGFVMDRDRKVVANFKLLIGRDSLGMFVEEASSASSTIERYSSNPAKFARLAFKYLREKFGFEFNDDVNELWVGTQTLRNRYWKTTNRMKRVVQLFEPGRPTWLLADLNSNDSFSKEDADSLRRLTEGDRYLKQVLLRQPQRLIVIRDGHSKVYHPDTCEVDLGIP